MNETSTKTENVIAVAITSPNEWFSRAATLTDREALKNLKKRMVDILNDAIEAATSNDSAFRG